MDILLEDSAVDIHQVAMEEEEEAATRVFPLAVDTEAVDIQAVEDMVVAAVTAVMPPLLEVNK